MQKAFSGRFGFDMLESRTFKLPVKNKATGTPLNDVVSVRINTNVLMFTYICVGLSALLGLTDRAMREPQHIDRARDWLHVSLCV